MDEQIRRAERNGDYERAGRLRCKVEGCLLIGLVQPIERSYDLMKQVTILHIKLTDGRYEPIALPDTLLYGLAFGGPNLHDRIDSFRQGLAKICLRLGTCSRCTKSNGMAPHFLNSIQQELQRMFT